jgi:hypothetical protein
MLVQAAEVRDIALIQLLSAVPARRPAYRRDGTVSQAVSGG